MSNVVRNRLKYIYGDASEEVFFKLEKLMDHYKDDPVIKSKRKKYQNKKLFSEKDSILITYGDSIKKKGEKPLKTLYRFLRKHVKSSINGVHILPFFPYSSDDGFSVIDFKKVNPSLGDWQDIRRIGKEYRLMADLVINHISQKSKWFQEFLKGSEKYQDYFISFDKKINTSSVFRPRLNPLLTPFKTKKGIRYIWTTFSDDQIDLNFANPEVFLEMVDVLLFYLSNHVEMIRLDAVGYLWKELGTSCFHHKKTHEMVKLFRNIFEEVAPYAVFVIEINGPFNDIISYFGDKDEGQMVYQFSFPPLVFDAFLRQDSAYLKKFYQKVKEVDTENLFFNFLASHDGIAVLGAKGFLNQTALNNMVEEIQKHNGYVSCRSTPKGEVPYELNINYFDAVNNPNLEMPMDIEVKKFIASQSLIIFSKGIPGIYIHSLLGSRNWNKGVEDALRKEKRGNPNNKYRKVNREKLKYEVLEKELKKNSVRKRVLENYLKIIKVRKQHKDFNPYLGEEILKSDKRLVVLKRNKITFVLNLSSDEIALEKYKGKLNLLNKKKFSGEAEPFGIYCLR